MREFKLKKEDLPENSKMYVNFVELNKMRQSSPDIKSEYEKSENGFPNNPPKTSTKEKQENQ